MNKIQPPIERSDPEDTENSLFDVMPMDSRVSSFVDGLPTKDEILNEDLLVLNDQKDWPFCVGSNK
jgi:hypothetical protein